MFNHPALQRHLDIIKHIHSSCVIPKYSLLMTGESGVGKTFIAKHYCAMYPSIEMPEKTVYRVLYCKLMQTKSAIDLLLQLTMALGAIPARTTTKVYLAQKRLLHLLKEHKVELIILDEVQECLPDVDGIMAQRMAKQFASLIDCSGIPLVLLGTPTAARLLNLKYGDSKHQLFGEEQLSRRFISEQRIYPIPQRCQAWLDCVNYFCDKFIFEKFSMQDKAVLNRLYLATNGKPGLIEKLFHFLPQEQTAIAPDELQQSYQLSISSTSINPFDNDTLSNNDVLNILDSWRCRK